jgi:hypothetical protein
MRTALVIVAAALLAASPAAAKSAKSFAPGHQAKAMGTHGHSYNAPGQVKKRLHLKNARSVAPGHMKGR